LLKLSSHICCSSSLVYCQTCCAGMSGDEVRRAKSDKTQYSLMQRGVSSETSPQWFLSRGRSATFDEANLTSPSSVRNRKSRALLKNHSDSYLDWAETVGPASSSSASKKANTCCCRMPGLLRLIILALGAHGQGMFLVVVSIALNVYVGATNLEFVDASFFNGVGILLAMLLSLRMGKCVGMRAQLIQRVLSMLNSAQNLMYLVAGHDAEKRRILHTVFAYVFAQIARWFNKDLPESDCWLGPPLDALPAIFQDRARYEGGCIELDAPPRQLIFFLSEVIDEVYERPQEDDTKYDSVSVLRRWHRLVDQDLNNIMIQYDFLSTQQEELLPPQFVLLVSSLIFWYVALYPWCVADESALVLGLTTTAMGMTFYCLNALTDEIATPLKHHDHSWNLMSSFQEAFEKIATVEVLRLRHKDATEKKTPYDEFVRAEMSRDEFVRDVSQEDVP